VETIVDVTLTNGVPLIAALPREASFEIGAQINLSFDPASAPLFEA